METSCRFRTLGLRQLFLASALRLIELEFEIDSRRKLLGRGYLLWKRVPPIEMIPYGDGNLLTIVGIRVK